MAVYSYLRKDSAFFWLKWLNLETGQWEYESSKVRSDDPDADAKLAKKINKIELETLKGAKAVESRNAGWSWVPEFIRLSVSNSNSLRVYSTYWSQLHKFLVERDIKNPKDLTRDDVFEYVSWRCGQVKEKSKRSPGKNTALAELRMLGRVLEEARERKMVEVNVAKNLKIKADQSKVKPELLDEEIQKIMEALKAEPEWMQASFRIAVETGLRFSETKIDLMRNVNWQEKEALIDDPKGGEGRAFTIPLTDSLLEYLRELRASGRRTTWELPKGILHGMAWRKLFDRLNMPDVCFHCTRVTFITRGARAGIPESVMRQMVNHADDEIHRIYQRVNVSDARAWLDRTGFSVLPQKQTAASSSATQGTRSKSRARRRG